MLRHTAPMECCRNISGWQHHTVLDITTLEDLEGNAASVTPRHVSKHGDALRSEH